MNRIKSSSFLCRVNRKDGIAIFHSLRGGICLVDEKINNLFKIFETPSIIEDVISNHPEYSKDDIETFVQIFAQRGFLIDENYDEYGAYDKILADHEANLIAGQQVGVVQLIVTNACNFRCEYCFINTIYSSKEREELQHAKHNQVMTPEDAIEYLTIVINMRKKCGKNSLHIQFFGGEPLANWKTCKSVLDYFGNGEKFGIKITYGIVTNGSLITQEVADYFKKYKLPVVVSFDSPKGDNRVLASGEPAFSKIVAGIKILKENGNTLIFNSVFSKETFKSFDMELIDFAKDNNVSEIGVLFDLDLDFYDMYSSDEIVDKLWEVYKYGQEKGVLVTGYWHMIFQNIIGYDRALTLGYKTCSATGCQFSIEPSGDVFSCKGASGYFGNVKDLDALFTSPKYIQHAMRFLRNSPKCKNCPLEHFCSGVCLGPLEKKYGTIDAVAESTCDVYKKIVKKLIEDLNSNNIDTFELA